MSCTDHAGHRRCLVLAALVTALPVAEWEQWAVAHHYVEKHGDEAPIVIAMRADELFERGEISGANTYVAVMRKSEQLLTRNDGSVH